MLLDFLNINISFSFTILNILYLFLSIVGFILLFKFVLIYILRIILMDKIIGDTSRNIDLNKDKHLFYKFYLFQTKRGFLLYYISDISMKLEDGKRIGDNFFIFRNKDNKTPLNLN